MLLVFKAKEYYLKSCIKCKMKQVQLTKKHVKLAPALIRGLSYLTMHM